MELKKLITKDLDLIEINKETMENLYKNFSEEEIIGMLKYPYVDLFEKEKFRFENGYERCDISYKIWQIVLRKENIAIGHAGYHTWRFPHKSAELGYRLYSDEYKKQGYMSQAIEEILRHGFNEMNLNRVEAHVGPDNVPSLKLVEKFGFFKEGYLRKDFIPSMGAEPEDSVLFSLLKEEYNGKN